MTPATVLQTFAHGGAPLVRYAQSPELCGKGFCEGLDYSGSGIRAYLAPRVGPTFEVIVFRTPADARQIVELVRRGARTGAVQRGNAGLFWLRAYPNLAARRIFAKIRP